MTYSLENCFNCGKALWAFVPEKGAHATLREVSEDELRMDSVAPQEAAEGTLHHVAPGATQYRCRECLANSADVKQPIESLGQLRCSCGRIHFVGYVTIEC